MSKRLIDGDDYTWPVGSEIETAEGMIDALIQQVAPQVKAQIEPTIKPDEETITDGDLVYLDSNGKLRKFSTASPAPGDPQDGCAVIPAPPFRNGAHYLVMDCRTVDQKLRDELAAINARLARIEAIVSGETVKEMYTK